MDEKASRALDDLLPLDENVDHAPELRGGDGKPLLNVFPGDRVEISAETHLLNLSEQPLFPGRELTLEFRKRENAAVLLEPPFMDKRLER